MFDRLLLLPAEFEFVVIADTHFMLETGQGREEFSSRARQTARADAALRLAASLNAEFAIHLGDLVQEFPETEAFPTAMNTAITQLESCGLAAYHVAGNHDVGDKPDPIMPTRPVSAESLVYWNEKFGTSWYSFDRSDCHFIVLNSQIMNTTLPEAEQQWTWLKNDLAGHSSQRIFLFLHLPPFLWDADEPALGHYDNIADPARTRLVQLIKKYQVDWMVAGHVHCAFFDLISSDNEKSTRYLIANSTSFTRPGFCHMFTSQPPADHGRDDSPKLGFYLFRVFKNRVDTHWIRTSGEISVDSTNSTKKFLTRTSATQSESPLGVTLRHPISNVTDIPVAWPSAIRQRVRNDYPLLACTELGTAWVRTPLKDFEDSFLTNRLQILRREGVRLSASTIWSDDVDVAGIVENQQLLFDQLELQLAGSATLSIDQLNVLRECRDKLTLSTIIPNEAVTGKQHLRTRHGFRLDELPALHQQLVDVDAQINRVLCRLEGEPSLWENVQKACELDSLDRIGCIDFSWEQTTTDDNTATNRVSEALFAMMLLPGSRLFVDPLIDFDRTMDVCHGLLDPLCNPRPMFHSLKHLNSILAAATDKMQPDDQFTPVDMEKTTERLFVMKASKQTLCLILQENDPNTNNASEVVAAITPMLSGSKQWRLFHLVAGTVMNGTGDETDLLSSIDSVTEPILLWFQ